MGQRLLIAVDAGVGVSAGALAEVWQADEQAVAVGPATVTEPAGQEFLPGVMEVVAIPLAVNLASSVVYDLIRRLVARCRGGRAATRDVELAEVTTAAGDRLVVVRIHETLR